MTPLRQRMIEGMRVRNFAERTQSAYVYQVAKFAWFFGRSPELLGLEEIRRYQVHLVKEQVSWSMLNQAVAALRFLYRKTLGRDWAIEHIPYAKRSKPLPVVLSLEEVKRFLEAIESMKYRAILTTAYAAGLRVSEVARLKTSDIDSQRGLIRVCDGKGRKDRYVMLSPKLLAYLREYWRVVHPPTDYLFPGASPEKPITRASIAKACRKALLASGLGKRVTPHTLRHNAGSRIMPGGTADRRRMGGSLAA